MGGDEGVNTLELTEHANEFLSEYYNMKLTIPIKIIGISIIKVPPPKNPHRTNPSYPYPNLIINSPPSFA
jgi:hypothetical protein